MKIIDRYRRLPKPLKASLWFIVCTFLQSGISFITTPIFTRLLSTEEYGQYSVIISWKAIISVFVSLNIFSAVYTQGLVKFEKDDCKYASSMQGLLMFLCITWLIIYFVFSEFWEKIFNLNRGEILAITGLIWTSGVYSLWAAEQRGKYKYIGLIIVTMASSLLKPLMGILSVLYFENKVDARIISMLLVEICCYCWILPYEYKKGGIFFHKRYWKYALLMNIPLVPHYLSQTILNNSDRIMISMVAGSSASGIYSLASSISQIMIIFSSAIIQSMNPWIFKKIKDDKTSDIRRVAYISLVFIAFLNILLMGFAPEAVLIFGSREYYDAIWVIPPISMSVYFMFAYSLFATFEFYYEKTHLISIASFISAGMNVLLNYIFIPRFGYIAAGYTTLLCYILYTIFHYFSMIHITKKYQCFNPYRILDILLITGIFVMMGFSFLIFYGNIALRYSFVLLIVLFGFFYRKKLINFWCELQEIKKA